MVPGARSTVLRRIFLQVSLVPNQRFQRLFTRILIPMATTPLSPSTAVQGLKIQPFLLDHPTFVIPAQVAQSPGFAARRDRHGRPPGFDGEAREVLQRAESHSNSRCVSRQAARKGETMGYVESLSYTRPECNYQIVFIPVYRTKAVVGQLRGELGEVSRRLAPEGQRHRRGASDAG